MSTSQLNFRKSLNSSRTFSLIFFFLLASFVKAFSQQNVSVNTTSVLSDVSINPLGINMDYFEDDNARRPAGSRTMAAALSDLQVKYLRYPGGEKADAYLWSIPPFTAPNPKMARYGNEWPSNDPAYWAPSGDPNGNWTRPIYDFDEFMSDAIASGGEPVIVVAYDGIYKAAPAGGTSLTFDQALETAKAWVQYAKIKYPDKVKYWAIGNETWLDAWGGKTPPGGFTQYGKDVAVFAQAMKAIDPSIKIGINATSTAQFDDALAQCAEYVDFADVHQYPAYQWTYANYQKGNPDALKTVISAAASIAKLPEPHKSRIFIALTETSALSWASWDDEGANLGHALVTFDILAQVVNDKRVKIAQFWNTHWVAASSDMHPSAADALLSTNELNAQGLALKVLSSNLLKKMVSATSTSTVRTWASLDDSTGALNIYLINKATSATSAVVSLQNYTANPDVSRWEMKGASITDFYPTYSQTTNVTATAAGKISLTLAPTSITVLKVTGATTTVVTGTDDVNIKHNSLEDEAINAYPNPFTNKITFNLIMKKDGPLNVKILSSDGIVVKSINYGKLIKGLHSFTWNGDFSDRNSVRAGLYFIKCISDGKVKTVKVLKN